MEQKHKWSWGARHADVGGESPGREHSQYQGPEAGTLCTCVRERGNSVAGGGREGCMLAGVDLNAIEGQIR